MALNCLGAGILGEVITHLGVLRYGFFWYCRLIFPLLDFAFG